MALVQRHYHQLGLLSLALFDAEGGHFAVYQRACARDTDGDAGAEANGAGLSQA